MVGEGIKTSDTKSDKFEVEIKNNIEKFLSSQEEPIKSLKVSRYEGTDTKFYSDVKITNPSNEKNVWVEVKLNKYANLGGPSFKYQDGQWTCTTSDEEDHLTQFYLDAINKGSEKFISFCKSYLKTDDIRLPKDFSPELIDAWKKSGSVDDTDNDVQFITDKIPLEGFGEKIAEYYKTAKYEPVYYIQVDDELYIIDPEYNPLGLKTRDGHELKTLADTYRIGRIQFRAKGIEKKLKDEVKYYYSIVCDVKILADDEKYKTEYVCSFKSESKFPIIGNIETTTVKESYEPPYSLEQIRQKYDDETYNRLSTDPIHKWRAETGIELIHREPSKDEFERIWKNWQLMPDEMKEKSDKKSIELFGLDNRQNYEKISRSYGMTNEAKEFFERSVRVILEDWRPECDDAPYNQWGERWLTLDDNHYVTATLRQILEDVAIDHTEEHRPDTIRLSSVHRTEHGVFIATLFGGCNGGGDYKNLIFYLAAVKKFVKKVVEKFGKTWLVDWTNDCADDVWTLRVAFRDEKGEEEDQEMVEIYNTLMGIEAEDDGGEPIEEGKFDFRLPDEAHARPGQRFAFQNKHDSYGGDDYLNVAEIGSKLLAKEHNKYGWFAAKDAPDRDKCKVFIEVDDGNDSKYAVVGNKRDRFYNKFLICAVATKDKNKAMTVDRFVNNLFISTGLIYLSQAKQHLFVFMNPGDEMVYVCNGMRMDGTDVILEMEPSPDYKYEANLANKELAEADADIGGQKSDNIPANGVKIWIDDIREAPAGFKWIKSVNDFIDYCYENGIDNVTLIDTDHDAGDYQKFGGDYIRCFDYLEANDCEGITVHIHSANPVGANNIRRIITKNKDRGWREIRNT